MLQAKKCCANTFNVILRLCAHTEFNAIMSARHSSCSCLFQRDSMLASTSELARMHIFTVCERIVCNNILQGRPVLFSFLNPFPGFFSSPHPSMKQFLHRKPTAIFEKASLFFSRCDRQDRTIRCGSDNYFHSICCSARLGVSISQ